MTSAPLPTWSPTRATRPTSPPCSTGPQQPGCAVIPFGGGTSVVGGVECRDRSRPVVSLDLSRLSGIVEIDEVSLAVRIRAGTLGPTIEDGLRPYGLTLRHFPQSFEFSTLGGWIATRAGGHYATGYTHIDDLVEARPRRHADRRGPVAARALVGSRAVTRTGSGWAPRGRLV